MTDSSQYSDCYDRNRKSWSEQEDIILAKLVRKYGTKRWIEISKAMADMYQLNEKSGKQCRQRWVNHLDPKINKKKWSPQEEKTIFDAHKSFGNKWKQIAKLLDNRTDNSIKNHFYSILRKGLRRINKMLGDGKSTQLVKEIRTSVLSKLGKMQKESEQNEVNQFLTESNIYEFLFQFAMMRSCSISQKNLSENIKENFHIMIHHLMSLSGQEKLKKEKDAQENKEKRQRKMSQQSIKSSLDQCIDEENRDCFNQREELRKSERVKINIYKCAQKQQQEKLQKEKVQKEKKQLDVFALNCDIDKFFNTGPFDIEKSQFQQQQYSQSQKIAKDQKQNIIQNDQQQEYFTAPIFQINIEEQSANPSCSQSKQEGDFGFAFNQSPRFNRLDHILARTPRIYSPSSFSFCNNNASTAQSLKSLENLGSLAKKEIAQGEYDFFKNIVENLRSDINSRATGTLRINSSRSSMPDQFLRPNGSSSSLTPQSCSNE